MEGVIVGGWEYVQAAWGISLSVLFLAVVVINVRLSKARKRS